MATEIKKSSLEESVFSDSNSSSFTNNIIGEEEEEMLSVENEQFDFNEKPNFDEEAMLIENENFKTDEEIARELQQTEIKEKTYKSLIHLLSSSQMYALFLKDRLQQDEINIRLGRKKTLKEKNCNSKTQKSGGKPKLSEVITKENVEQTISANETKKEEVEYEEDYFAETRVTRLGFTVSYKQPLLLEGAVMRDYQLKGLEWMKCMFSNGVNGILADEMGLGKTIQVISFICHLIEQGIEGPFLVVAPLSTLSNWKSEFEKFAPKVPTLLYHGSKRKEELQDKFYQKFKVLDKKAHYVILTSFQIPIVDKAFLSKINWYYLIIDEGHRIKNHNSTLSRVLRDFSTIGRLLLTGTPLQNNLSELWSLLNFLLPEVFSSLEVFESWLDIKELETNGSKFIEKKLNIDIVSILQEILMPFLLRREKKDVNLNLSFKKKVLIYCPLSANQKKLYEAVLDRSIEKYLINNENDVNIEQPLAKRSSFLRSPYGRTKIESASAEIKKLQRLPKVKEKLPDQEIQNILKKTNRKNVQMLLRKIANHPYMIEFPVLEGTEEYQIDEDIVFQSGKMLILDAMLSKLHVRGHKVLIFSNFTTLLDILEHYAELRNYTYCRLDGKLKIEEKDGEIHKFMTDTNIFLFLMSIGAGGLGINLTAADTVIFFDSHWNPQVNLQSEDRCHRFGQTKPVNIYILCSSSTIDEKIIERGNAKRRLEKIIFQEGKFDAKFTKNITNFQELKKLMDSVKHDVVIKSNGFVLSDEELEALLDRNESTTNLMSEGDKKLFTVLN